MSAPNTQRRLHWRRALLATTAALSLGAQNAAFAATVCSDGKGFPAGGYQIGSAALPGSPNNWTEGVFSGSVGSVFVPDASFTEFNDPAQPRTGGGHNWVFDQGSTLCRVNDTGAQGAVATSWTLPPAGSANCVLLPIIKNGVVTNIGDVPGQGRAITPTCDPTKLSITGPNPANTYFNQLGCAISFADNGTDPVTGAIKATTPATATSFILAVGIKSGLFQIPLKNVLNPVVGGPAGKFAVGQNYYQAGGNNGEILGAKPTSGAISPDGMFAMITSTRNQQAVFACLNPLGDPGDPTLPPNFTSFSYTQTTQVQCMQVGQNNLKQDATTNFGPDNQPYFGGQRVVNAFNGNPGGPFANAWPQCIYQGAGLPLATAGSAQQMLNFKTVFSGNGQNHCGSAQPNFSLGSGAQVTQPSAIVTHGSYMYLAPIGGIVVQAKVIPTANGTQYSNIQTYVTGTSLVTGLGFADDLTYPGGNGAGSLIVYGDPSGIGAPADEVLTRVPLCEP
jgi:hypothetical protein